MNIYSKSYICFCMYICLLHLSIMLFVGNFLHFCEVSEGMVCVSVSVIWSICLIIHLDVNHVVSMTGITTILVKLLQLMWCYVTSFAMGQSIFSAVSSKDMFHIIMILCHIHLVLRKGTRSSSHYRELELKLKPREYLNLRGDQKILCLGGPKI